MNLAFSDVVSREHHLTATRVSRKGIVMRYLQGLFSKFPTKAGHDGRVVSTSDCYAGGLPNKSSILPLLKHACEERDQLPC